MRALMRREGQHDGIELFEGGQQIGALALGERRRTALVGDGPHGGATAGLGDGVAGIGMAQADAVAAIQPVAPFGCCGGLSGVLVESPIRECLRIAQWAIRLGAQAGDESALNRAAKLVAASAGVSPWLRRIHQAAAGAYQWAGSPRGSPPWWPPIGLEKAPLGQSE